MRPLLSILFLFMQFSGKISQIGGLRPHLLWLGVLCLSPFGEILDLLLKIFDFFMPVTDTL